MTDHTDDRTSEDSVTLFGQVIERIRRETTSLLVENLAHLEEIEAARRGHTTEEQLLTSRALYRLALRLKDLVAWTNALQAWSTGKASAPEERLQFRDRGLEKEALSVQGLSAKTQELSERGGDLYERAGFLEDILFESDEPPISLVDTDIDSDEMACAYH